MSEWQPIETAPKDERLDLWAKTRSGQNSGRVTDCEWKQMEEGKMVWCYAWDGKWWVIDTEITHWMRPPKAPA